MSEDTSTKSLGRGQPQAGQGVPACERFLEASRRYLFEVELPPVRDPLWPRLQAPQQVRISSRVARRSPAWPAAWAPWDRR